jgi:hypothetical protein
MTDVPDWEKKYWANRLQQKTSGQHQQQMPQQPHYEPLHVTQARLKGQDPNQLMRSLGVQIDGFSNMDDPRVMASREITGQLSARDQVTGAKVVMLREGARYFRQVQSEAYGVSIPLLRSMGQITNATGREFELRGPSRGYIIDGLNVIDAGKMNESPERFVSLMKVRAPFIGDIFVESSAVIESFNGGRTILRG